MNYYNSDPLQTIRYGNNFFVWNGYWEQYEGDTLANYATVYLFFQWLRIHASNDGGIYRDILYSTHRDYRSVVDAAALRMSAALSSWETVLGTWFHANLLNAGTGLKGYKGQITTTKWQFFNTGGYTWPLSSGEALAVQSSGGQYSYTGGSGTSIRYHGINTTTHAIDTVGPTYTGNLILVYNANSSYAAADQTAVLPSVSDSESTELVTANVVAFYDLPLSYPVDVHFATGDGFSPASARVDPFRMLNERSSDGGRVR